MSLVFWRLHPAVQHDVVDSLGWRSLRPLQDQAIDPVLYGRHALPAAPTAGGKTEAAVLALLSTHGARALARTIGALRLSAARAAE